MGCVDPNGNSCIPSVCEPVISYGLRDCDDNDEYTHPYAAEFEYDDGDFIDASLCMRDYDRDGYGDMHLDVTLYPADFYLGHDCNDERDYIHPHQNEICEGFNEEQIDNDCDGDVNKAGEAPWVLENPLQNLYVDTDGDGFGDPSESVIPACEVDDGFVFNATDCDDDDPTIYPSAEEICDGIDQNCDQSIDEAGLAGISRYLQVYDHV